MLDGNRALRALGCSWHVATLCHLAAESGGYVTGSSETVFSAG